MISLAKWETKTAMRLLLGMAHIQRALQRAVTSSWLSHAAHFGGIWLHPCEAIQQGPGIKQLASVLSSLEKGTPGLGAREPAYSGASSFPAAMHRATAG